jgi:hypothetical protein
MVEYFVLSKWEMPKKNKKSVVLMVQTMTKHGREPAQRCCASVTVALESGPWILADQGVQ